MSSKRREVAVQWGWAVADALIAGASVVVAAWLRFDLDVAKATHQHVLAFAAIAFGVQVAASGTLNALTHDHVRGSFEETAKVAKSSFVLGVVLLILRQVLGWEAVPRSLPFVVPVFSLMGMFALRFIVRSYRARRTTVGEHDTPAIVFGAGDGGRRLIRALVRDTSAAGKLVPVAVIDDDPRKRRMAIEGLRVSGSLADLESLVERTGATKLAVAIPSLSAERLREVSAAAKSLAVDVLVLPPVGRLLGPVSRADLHDLNLEDLLGRQQVSLDETAISTTITGKRVLVTGAGGSIGSELARQISKFGPAKLVLLDRDESALHGTQLSLTGRALLDDGTLALCDIRDAEGLRRVFETERPQVVFHAAALKHLTLLEQFPLEAWQTNVLGTANVLAAAQSADVETFVNISTDKAANPTSVLGYSKRVAERLTADFATTHSGTYVSVRFGNVLGSRGSVITAFTHQIERGGPVTVTHPDVERYFMLIPEACQLVLQAAAIGGDGEVMVLEMGSPVRIVDVAKTLIGLSGKSDIEVVFTGLRPGEKMTEELFAGADNVRATSHRLVTSVTVSPLAVGGLATQRFTNADKGRAWMLGESGDPVQGVVP